MRPVRVVTMNHGHVQPLRARGIEAEVEIELDTFTPLQEAWVDPEVDAFEVGLLNYVCAAAGRQDDSVDGVVGVPFFIRRAFAHRNVFTLRSSSLVSFRELAGRRVGTNMWLGSANFWTREAIRDAGVDMRDIKWIIAPLREQGSIPNEDVPDFVEQVRTPGVSLLALLLEGKIDAFIYPAAPDEAFAGGPLVHLLRNYRQVERDYFRSSHIFPAQHILAIRRDRLRREPDLAAALFQAFESSRVQWEQERRFMAETSPWLLADLEESTELMGFDWQPNGVESNRAMLARLCCGVAHERLAPHAVEPRTLFSEFESTCGEA